MLVFLPHQALVMMDAIVRTLIRVVTDPHAIAGMGNGGGIRIGKEKIAG